LVPGVRTVLDIGGQDCKIIECKDGSVLKFEMNDKCAAGTGRFFEVLSEHLVPGTRTVLDIGGQDCKILECKEGSVLKFEMNDKCAAGTGRFFEVLSEHLFNVSIDELSDLAAASTNGARVSSMCTVFAETEIVSMLSQGVSEADICRGMIEAVFRRIKAMAGAASIRITSPVVFMGGCARCATAKPILEEMIGMEVLVPEEPQMPAALGIALIARDDYLLDLQDNNQD
jgi:predicted CoA-substrate-specific enzyme activase